MTRRTIEIPENIYNDLLDTRNDSPEARFFRPLLNSAERASSAPSGSSAGDEQRVTALPTDLMDRAARGLQPVDANNNGFEGSAPVNRPAPQSRLDTAARGRGTEAQQAPAQRPTDAGVGTGPSAPGGAPQPAERLIDQLARSNNLDIKMAAQRVREEHDSAKGVTAPLGSTPRRTTTLWSIAKAVVLALLKDRSVKHAVAEGLTGSNNDVLHQAGVTAQGELLMRHLQPQGSQAPAVHAGLPVPATGTGSRGLNYRTILNNPQVESPATPRAQNSASASAIAPAPAP